jgi:hypothetical protein
MPNRTAEDLEDTNGLDDGEVPREKRIILPLSLLKPREKGHITSGDNGRKVMALD